MHQTLVGVHHLLQIQRFVAVVRKGGIGIEVLVSLDNLVGGGLRSDDLRAENATGEVAAIGDEVDIDV